MSNIPFITIPQENWVYTTPPQSPRANIPVQNTVNDFPLNTPLIGISLITGERFEFIINPSPSDDVIDDKSFVFDPELPHLFSYFGRNFDFDNHPDQGMLIF